MGELPIPASLKDLDAGWFSTLFQTRVLGVSDAGPTGGIAVTSRVARLRLTSDPVGSAPTSVVAKVANPKWQSGTDLYAREVSFYRDFARGSELPVPVCFHGDVDVASGAFVLILEDLGRVKPGHRLDGLTVSEAEAVVIGLADLHRRFWDAEMVRGLHVRGHEAAQVSRSVECLHQRLELIRAQGRYAVPDALVAAIPQLLEEYPTGMLRISHTPQTLIHSDLHVENFFLEARPNGFRLIVIDWQNPCFGNVAFDVGHVLSSLRPELSCKVRDEVINCYHEHLGLKSLDLDDLRADVAGAIRHQFVGSANWFATFEAESFRDSKTMQGHWTRLVSSLLVVENARD